MRCAGYTKDGKRCKRTVAGRRKYCCPGHRGTGKGRKSSKSKSKKRSSGRSVPASRKKSCSLLSGMTYLFYDYGNSDKFWAIKVQGRKTIAHYGRTGTCGTKATKTHPSPSAASSYARKKKNEKLNKGYYPIRRNPVDQGYECRRNP